MRPTAHDISFSLFGFPTSIQPFFWLIAVVIAALHVGPIDDNMPFWIAKLLLGMAGVLLAVLVHELGHAFSFRHLFKTPCEIILHGFGGAAVPLQHSPQHYGFRGAVARSFLAFSGPLAGFVLAFLMLALFQMTQSDRVSLFGFFLWWTAAISIFWGILNLLPIYPMDGGHIAREIFVFSSPRRGVEFSLIFSMMFAALLAVLALRYNEIFIAFIFGYFAYMNYQDLSFRSFRR